MSGIIWVNEHDPEVDLGLTSFSVTDLQLWGAGMTLERGVTSIPGSFTPSIAPLAIPGARAFRLSGQLLSASVSARDAELSKILDVFSGLLELRFGDAPNKVMEGLLTEESSAALIERSGFGFAPLKVQLDVVCADPRKRDRYVQSVAFGSSRIPVPLGTLASEGIIRIMGSATNPILTLRDSSGTVIQTLGFTIALGATDYLEIDLNLKKVTKYLSGVASDAFSTYSSGSWDRFILDPLYGSYELSNWPTLEVSAGTGLYVYARAWRN